ncbi:MAG: hypothetical protein MZV64_10355 [Ignavibacteriales bacterium]|nr:hypothetical protein [Ignavibacteriales bacterium]
MTARQGGGVRAHHDPVGPVIGLTIDEGLKRVVLRDIGNLAGALFLKHRGQRTGNLGHQGVGGGEDDQQLLGVVALQILPGQGDRLARFAARRRGDDQRHRGVAEGRPDACVRHDIPIQTTGEVLHGLPGACPFELAPGG